MKLRLLVVAAVVLLGVAVWISGAPRDARESPRKVARIPGGVSEIVEPEPLAIEHADDEPWKFERAPAEPPPVQAGAARFVFGGTPTQSGLIELRAIDALTREPLRRFSVRAASDTRFADARQDDPERVLELRLSPATYSLLVLSQGYEPVELPPTRVESGKVTRLDPAELQPGWGRIVGAVLADSSVTRGLSVELIGEGRHPCARCDERHDPQPTPGDAVETRSGWERETPCSSCGFARLSSRRVLSSDARFAFANLASGLYALQLLDGRGRPVGAERSVELEPGATAWISFDAPSWRLVEVELIDVDGASLAKEWSRRLATQQEDEDISPVATIHERNSVRFSFAFDDDGRAVATAFLDPPAPSGSGVAFAWSASARRRLMGLPRAPIDRGRLQSDSLRPAPIAPQFVRLALEGELDGSGIAIVGPLATTRLHLKVSVHQFSGEVEIPPSRETTRVVVRLQRVLSPAGEGISPRAGEPSIDGDTYLAWERRGLATARDH